MKKVFSLGLFVLCVAACPAGELKVATLDLRRVMTEYYKAQEGAKELRAKEVSFRKELEDLRLEGSKMLNEVEDLRRLSLENALHAAVRDEKRKSFELKLVDLRALEVKLETLKAQREADLHDAVARINKRVLDDVLKATGSLGEKEGFHLIFNASKANPAASDVLFARNVEDVTAKVLAALNATKPVPREGQEKR
jgi:Skp family chaperone for outer membrane proteins